MRIFMKAAAALILSFAVLLPSASAKDASLLEQELEPLRSAYESMTFPELMRSCGNIWIGRIVRAVPDAYDHRLPASEIEAVTAPDGSESYELVDRSTERWLAASTSVRMQILDSIGGYSFSGGSERLEGFSLVSRFVSQDGKQVITTPERDIPSLAGKFDGKLLIFGVSQYWTSRPQYVISPDGDSACCFKGGAYSSDGGVSIDDW